MTASNMISALVANFFVVFIGLSNISLLYHATGAGDSAYNGDVTGGYLDSAGHNRGFVWSAKGTFISFDFPGAATTDTVVFGSSKRGIIFGTYNDLSGLAHGFTRYPSGRESK
jgi:hypothetical protein